jgi:hypothetical protein
MRFRRSLTVMRDTSDIGDLPVEIASFFDTREVPWDLCFREYFGIVLYDDVGTLALKWG